MHDRLPRFFAATFAFLLFAPCAFAQAGLGHLEDATTPPKGVIRLRVATAWSRTDTRFTSSGTIPLGDVLTSDTLGVAKLPALAGTESAIASASGAPFTLMMGHSRLDATGREEVLPLVFEYGLTSRFAVNATVPIVRRRVTTLFRIDSAGSLANVGPNPNRTTSTNNALIQTQFANAQSQLAARITSCQADPSGANCAAIIAQGPTLLASSTAFAADLASLYGTSAGSGMAFVPMSATPAQLTIEGRIGGFNTSYQNLLGTSTNLIFSLPRGAGGPAGSANVTSFLIDDLGRDSLNSQERLGIGDVEVGLKFRVVDKPRTEKRTLGLQVAVASSARFPTGSRQTASDIVDLSLGEGSMIVDSRAALDARLGRFGLLATGSFATSVYDKDTTNLAFRNSRWTELDIAPRWHFSEPISIHAAYSLRSTDKFGGDQLIGGGVSYSTLSSYKGGRPLPLEMRFTHLEAISGDPGRPKFFRDQVELRIYYRLRR